MESKIFIECKSGNTINIATYDWNYRSRVNVYEATWDVKQYCDKSIQSVFDTCNYILNKTQYIKHKKKVTIVFWKNINSKKISCSVFVASGILWKAV